VVEAIDKLEQKSDSEARKEVLLEEAEAAGVDEDPHIRKAAQQLLDQLKPQPDGDQHVHPVGEEWEEDGRQDQL
jgi:hypothetical protein